MAAGFSGTASAADVSDTTEEVFSEALTEDSTETPFEEVTEGSDEAVTEGSTEEEIEIPERPVYSALDYVTLNKYTGFTLEAESTEVTDDDVTDSIKSGITTDYYTEVADRTTVQEGDTVNIDYVGKKDGEEFDGGSAEGYDLLIGSGTFIDGFEDGLIGAEVGQTLDLNLTFPEDYASEDLAGQDVVFTVTINSIKEFPEITDDLINEITGGEYTTVDDYRDYIRDQLQQQKESERESALQSDIMTQLTENNTVDSYPDGLVDYYTAVYKSQYNTYAQYYGVELEDLVESYLGMTMEDFEAELASEAETEVNQELILEAIAEKESLEITDDEYEEACEEYASLSGYSDAEEFKENVDQEEFTRYLLMQKALKFVEDNSTITEADASEAATEGGEAAAEEAAESVTEQETSAG